jgi:archaellum biogenesis protein FlaJ (TadC family)
MRASMTDPASRAKALRLTERRTKRLWTSWLIQVFISFAVIIAILELAVYEFSPLACWLALGGTVLLIPAMSVVRYTPIEMWSIL